MVSVGEQFNQVDTYLQQFQSLRSLRVDYERKWQLVSDYILPRRDFSVTQRPGQLRPHKVTSSIATNNNTRLAAFLLAYAFSPKRPFLTPNVKSGLVAAGRSTNLDNDSRDYLSALQWSVFDRMMLPNARLMLRAGSMLKEFCAFGCGVMWTGRKRFFGPYFNSRPIHACWWSENEQGEIDTLYFKMMLPLYRVFQRYPAARMLDGWGTQKDQPDEMALTSIVLACRPRNDGVKGAVAENKPFAFVAISEEKKAVLEESGYDSFPYSVFRNDPMPGEAYAEGFGCQVLPDVMVLNHLQQCIENAAEQKASPPLAMPARMFGKVLDRRPGAANLYNPAGLGLMRADQAIIKLDFTGDISDAVAIKQSLREDIDMGYFMDWMKLPDAVERTAEGAGERRDQRLRGAASIVANLEQPITNLGDRAMEIMNAEGMTPRGPAGLAGVNVDWEYAGPLALAQLSGNVQATLQLINARGLVAQQDPEAAQAVDLEESLRAIADALPTPPGLMQTRAKVAQDRAAMRAQQKLQQDAENAQKLAQAGQSAGAGINSLAQAAQTAGGGPGGPPGPAGAPAAFAPAAPFAPGLAA